MRTEGESQGTIGVNGMSDEKFEEKKDELRERRIPICEY